MGVAVVTAVAETSPPIAVVTVGGGRAVPGMVVAVVTAAITGGFAALSSVSELRSASALLAEQNATVVSADAAHAALTRVRINIDMVEFNSREVAGGTAGA